MKGTLLIISAPDHGLHLNLDQVRCVTLAKRKGKKTSEIHVYIGEINPLVFTEKDYPTEFTKLKEFFFTD